MSQTLLVFMLSLGAVTDAVPKPKESNEPSFLAQVKSFADFSGLRAFLSRVDSLLPSGMESVPYPTPYYLQHVPYYIPPDQRLPLQPRVFKQDSGKSKTPKKKK